MRYEFHPVRSSSFVGWVGEDNPTIRGMDVGLPKSGNPTYAAGEMQNVWKFRYQILTSSGFCDVLVLAETCMTLWGKYVSELQETYNKTKNRL